MIDARPEDLDTYGSARAALIADLRAVDDDGAGTIVPTCPEWTVKDVVAHVCGLNAELLAGIEPPLGTDERTRAQVGDRADDSLPQVLDEWEAHAGPIRELMAENLPLALGLTADLAVHAHDIAETLDAVSAPAPNATLAACRRYVPLLQERLAANLDIALTVDLGPDAIDAPILPTAGSEAVTLATTPTDFLLTVTGRRTRDHAESLGWSRPPGAILDHLTQYGPFRQN